MQDFKHYLRNKPSLISKKDFLVLFFTNNLFILHYMGENEKHTCDPNVWVNDYSDEFFRFTLYRVKNREVAEDLVQETFLAGLKALDNFRRDCPEKSWLYNILRNKIIDHFRKKTNQEIKRSSAATEIDDDSFYNQFFKKEGKGINHWTDNAMPDKWDISADLLMEREEFMQFLMLCISLLPKTWGKVFSLKNIEELSTNEICKEIGITPSNLWTIVHRAKLQLRGCLEKKWINQ